MITVDKILVAVSPEEIFSGPDPSQLEQEYKALAKRFHPDLGGNAEAFKILNVLHIKAKEKIKLGVWEIPGQLDLVASDGKQYRIHYFKDFVNGVATGYIGKAIVAYVFDSQYSDLADVAIKNLNALKFDGKEKMQAQVPKIKKSFKTMDGRAVIVFEKPEDVLRLRDVVDHFHGKLNPKHAAWITTRMSNFVCWLQHIGMTHNDLSMDTIYICPEHHTVMVIGGWWHAVAIGSRMQRAQTGRTISALPRTVADTKLSEVRTDLTLVRLLGREMLGDSTGMSFIKNKEIPEAFSSWTKESPTANPVKDYENWEKTVVKAFGERRFTVLNLSHDDVYKK